MRRSTGGSTVGCGIAIVVMIASLCATPGIASAQGSTCREPDRAVEVLAQLYRHCAAPDSEFRATPIESNFPAMIIRAWAPVAGDKAIPILKELADLPPDTHCYPMRDAVRNALAKLGDAEAYGQMKRDVQKGTESGWNLTLINDDFVVVTMVQFLIDHVDDPRMQTSQGPSDGPYDYRDPLLEEIKDFARTRRIPEFPDADYSPSGIEKWKAWLAKYKGKEFSKPVSEGVADTYLRCLARKVEWGFPDAVLDIGSSGRPDSAAVLKDFPTPPVGEPMGARKFFPEILRLDEEKRNPALETQGNIEVALAILGDKEMLAQIRAELEDSRGAFTPVEAVRKLKFIGGFAAADALVDSLGNLRGLQKQGEENFAQCLRPSIYTGLHPTPEQQESTRQQCSRLGYFVQVGRVNALVLQTLAQLVMNSPLPADAQPTAENFEKWKSWWNENKDGATFIAQRPGQTFE
jgi:hypothetical protein